MMYVELREKNKKYYVLFRDDDEDSKSKPVAQFVSANEVESYNIAKQYAKQNKLSHPNLINKAKRQTIEAFLEKGKWKIGIEG